jgi:hypothetical protein
MAIHEDRFCRRRPWSDFIREVGSGGRGSIASTQRPTHSYVNLQEDFLHRAEIFYISRVKISDFGKKVQLIRNL